MLVCVLSCCEYDDDGELSLGFSADESLAPEAYWPLGFLIYPSPPIEISQLFHPHYTLMARW